MKKTSLILMLLLFSLPVATVSHAASLTLNWDPSPSGTVAGYKIYYKLAGSPNFDGTGVLQGDSPIDVGSQLFAQLDGLADSTGYAFTVTSYNSQGEESAYSNVVNVTTAAANDPAGTPDLYVPALLSPANQASGLPTSVVFDWSDPSDSRNVDYTLVFGTDPALAGSTYSASAFPGQKSGVPFSAAPTMALSGLLCLALPLRKRFKVILGALVFCTFLFLGACGSDNGGSTLATTPPDQAPAAFTSEIKSISDSSFEIYDFEPGTTYYWKIVADDGLNRTESEIRSFSTAPQ